MWYLGVTTDWVLQNTEDPLFLKFLNSPRPPEDAAAALLGFAEDLKAAVQAWQQGQRVYLHPPRRMVRAIKRSWRPSTRKSEPAAITRSISRLSKGRDGKLHEQISA